MNTTTVTLNTADIDRLRQLLRKHESHIPATTWQRSSDPLVVMFALVHTCESLQQIINGKAR